MQKNKILLFGLSHSAIEIANRLLAKNKPFLVIDNDIAMQEKAEKLGIPFRLLDYSEDEVLLELGIENDVLFVFALFDEDVHNLFLTLCIRALNPKVQIIAISHSKEAVHKLEIAGATTVLDPYQMCGKRIYKLISQPEVMRVVDATLFGEEDVNLEQITITKESPINGAFLHHCYPEGQYNILLVGIHDKELKKQFVFIIEGHNHRLEEGDVLVVIGQNEEIKRFRSDFKL